MYCRKCGAEIKETSKFCDNCGCEVVKVKPVVNQVELHPYYTQEKALETMKYYDVIPEAWAPLGGGDIIHLKMKC